MLHAFKPRHLIILCIIFLAACQTHKEQPKPKVDPTPVARKNVAPAPAAKPAPAMTKEAAIKRLLAEADYALSQNQLLMPLSDNAHDRYHAVLLLDRENTQAKSGLQAITLRYLDMARDAASKSSYSQALSHIKNARDLDPKNKMIIDLEAAIKKEASGRAAAYVYKPGPGEHLLDAKELSNKSDALASQLGGIAEKAKETGDLVMIIARSDAEGRWIYQKMREAVPGYLLRGDIKIGNPARIQFVPLLQ